MSPELIVVPRAGTARVRACIRFGWSCGDDPTDEEGAEPIEIKRCLLRAPHSLDDRGEREQLLADEPDDEVVVVAIEPMTGEPDVVGVIGGAERHPDLPVLGENRALLFRRQLGEGAAASERIPDRP